MPSRWAPSRSVVSKTWYVMADPLATTKRPPADAGGLRAQVGLGCARLVDNEPVAHAVHYAGRPKYADRHPRSWTNGLGSWTWGRSGSWSWACQGAARRPSARCW